MARMMTEDFIGTCQWCFGEYKVNPRGEMVLHGYSRPGYGHTVGNCQGYAHQPFEYAHDLTEVRIAELKAGIARNERHLAKIDAGEIKQIRNPNFIPEGDKRKNNPMYNDSSYHTEYYTPEHRSFAFYLRNMRTAIANEIRWDGEVVAYLQNAVDNWTKKGIIGLDSPATGKERYVRGAYDPDKAREAEEAKQRKAERDAKPGKVTINFYGNVFFPDRNAEYDEAQWRAGIDRHHNEEAEFKARIKAWAKATFPGKTWVGDGDDSEIYHITGERGWGSGRVVVAVRPEWQHLDKVMSLFPGAHRYDKDTNRRDAATKQGIGKGKDIRLWVSADQLPS